MFSIDDNILTTPAPNLQQKINCPILKGREGLTKSVKIHRQERGGGREAITDRATLAGLGKNIVIGLFSVINPRFQRSIILGS